MLGNNLEFLKNFGIKYINEIILTVLWVLAIIIINPIGEFPLNDDWAYSKDVYYLSQEGRLVLSDWPAMTLIAQVLWGALVTWIFGFSFTVLRLSTLVIGLFTVVIFYRILVNITKNRNTSLAGALLLMYTPLFFINSYTFMTEVYFLFTLNLSLFYFYKFYDTERINFLLISSFFLLICTLIRQPGLALGIAFAMVYLFNQRITLKRLIVSFLPTIIALAGLYSYSTWLRLTNRVTKLSDINILIKHISEAPFEYYWTRLGVVALYFGLFSLPIIVLLIPRMLKKYHWYQYGIMLLLGMMAYIFGILNNFPAGNVLYNLGLGPKLLKDTYWKDNINPILSSQTMYWIKLFSLFSAAIIIVVFFTKAINTLRKIIQTTSSPAMLLRATSVVFFIIYLSFVIVNPQFFDRYVLPCLPFLFLILLPTESLLTKVGGAVFGLMMLMYGYFCLAATHDYLAWNKTRWQAIEYLTEEKKVEKTKIDGGFEFNAWYQTGPWNPEIKDKISWWCVASDDYVISFGNIKSFKTIKRIPYHRLLPPGTDSLSILQKEFKVIQDSAFPIICDCEKRSADKNFFLGNSMEFHGGTLQSNLKSLSGEYSIQLDSVNQFGLLSIYAEIQTNDHYIVKVWRKGADDKAGIVISTTTEHKLYDFNTKAVETNSKGWELIQSEIVIPENCNGLNLGIYLWNFGKSQVWFDDLEIIKHPNKKVDI